MNKSDKLIVFLLVALLGGWLYYSNRQQAEYRKALKEYVDAHPDYLDSLTNAAPAQASRYSRWRKIGNSSASRYAV